MFPRVKIWVSGFGVFALIISHNSVARISKTTWTITLIWGTMWMWLNFTVSKTILGKFSPCLKRCFHERGSKLSYAKRFFFYSMSTMLVLKWSISFYSFSTLPVCFGSLYWFLYSMKLHYLSQNKLLFL